MLLHKENGCASITYNWQNIKLKQVNNKFQRYETKFNCSKLSCKQLKSNYVQQLSSTTRIKVFNGIGNTIDTFHKSSSRQIHSYFTVHLHNTATTHNFPQM